MPQIIQIRHSTNVANNPTSADGTTAHLLPGELGVTIAASDTKLFVGTATANRMLFSTVDGDTTILSGTFLKLTGGTVTGPVHWSGTPTGAQAGITLVNKDYVDNAVAGGGQFQGGWDVAGNTPNLNPPTPAPSNGQYWIVSVDGTAPAGMPGVGGQALTVGTWVVWNATSSTWDTIPGGGITQGQADLRYLRLTGDTMQGAITMAAAYTPTVNTQQVATMNALATATSGMLTAVEVDGITIDGTGVSGDPLEVIKVDGGTY